MEKYLICRTHSSIGTYELEKKLNEGYSVVTVNPIDNMLEYVLKKQTDDTLQTINLESNYFKLVERYLKDTKDCDGTLFCGCKKEECSYYMFLPECYKCLEKHLKQEF